MVKLFGWNITRQSLQERFRGFTDIAPGTTSAKTVKFWPGYKSWETRCKYYERIYNIHPLAKSCINTVAGKLTADGVFLAPSTQEKPHKDTADEARRECEDFNRKIGILPTIYETVTRMMKFGSAFWEVTHTPEFNVRLAPAQEYIEPLEQNDEGEIVRWRQRIQGKPIIEWEQDEIIHFPWNPTSLSWPYGTSQFVGLDTELETLEKLEQSIKNFMEKTAFPKELYQIGDENWIPSETDATNIKGTIKRWEPGKAFVTNAPIDYKAGGVGPRAIANLDDVLSFLKMQIVDGMMTVPVSIQYSSTYASSKEMATQERANLVLPLQRVIAWHIEKYVYKPYLESRGFSVKLCPSMSFNSPESGFSEKATSVAQLVSAGVWTWDMGARKMGCTEEEIESMRQTREKERKQQMEQMQQQQPFGQKKPPLEQKQGEPKANYPD